MVSIKLVDGGMECKLTLPLAPEERELLPNIGDMVRNFTDMNSAGVYIFEKGDSNANQ